MDLSKSYLWFEKYRPKVIDDVVLKDEVKKDFQKYIEQREIPHLLFSGPPGSGKSTCAMILSSPEGILSNPEDNLLLINGSKKETRGIGYVDDVIEPFLKLPPVNDKIRIVFIDEADYLTDQSMHSLRHVIEKYHKNARFILTVNNFSKIIEALQSRFQVYFFKELPNEFIDSFCRKILDSEEINYDDETLDYVINGLYPDVRKMVNSLQRYSTTKTLTVSKETVLLKENKVVELIVELVSLFKNSDLDNVPSIINNVLPLLDDYNLDYRLIYNKLFFTKIISADVKIIINKYANSHYSSLLPSMHFMSLVLEIATTLRDYRKLK